MTQPVNLPTSISQITIVPPATKRTRPAITTTTKDIVVSFENVDNTESNYKPDYLKVPDQVFKTMLANSLEGAESIIQWLDTPEKLKYARDYAQLVNPYSLLFSIER